MKLKIYIHKDKLYNFLVLMEPVVLINEIIDSNYFEMNCNHNKLVFKEYKTYTTVEIKKNIICKIKLKFIKRRIK